MYNRKPQQPQQQNAQNQLRPRASFPSPNPGPPRATQQQQRYPQNPPSVMNPRGFTPVPIQRLPPPSSGQSSYNNQSGDSGISSLKRNVPSSTSGSGTWNPNSIRNQFLSHGEQPSGSRLQNSAAQVVTNSSDFEFDDDVWGDDDDDMDMVMASQAVEEASSSATSATKAPGTSGYSYSSQPPSVLNQHGVIRDRAMPLHMIRYELALKESQSNGEEVLMEDFMPGGVLGGVISSSTSSGAPKRVVSSAEQIAELEKINSELKNDNYSCKGEVANLRRLLEKHQKEKQKEMVNRHNQERENQKKEKEAKDSAKKDFDKLMTDLRYKDNEIRTLIQKNEAYKKQMERLHNSSSSNASLLNTSISNLTLNTSRSSVSFPSRNTFLAPEIPASTRIQFPAQALPPIPVVKKDYKTIDVQTDQTVRPETVNDLAQKLWMEGEKCRQEILSVYLERISVKTSKNISRILPVFESIAEKAQNEIVRNLKNDGFPYEFMFPDNLKLAEFKLDEREIKSRNKTKPVLIPTFPFEYKDWDGIVGLEDAVRNCLQYQNNIWAAICFVGEDLIRRINFMRQGNRNSLYRPKNLIHFMKLVLWGRHLWKNFYPSFCDNWRKRENPRHLFLEDIRKWTGCMLWIGNRCFEVQDARTELRKLVLKTLVSLASNSYSCFYYTEANYLRVYNFMFYTLTLNENMNFENFYHCLQLSAALGRKAFYLKYMCMKKNDATCLAFQFATKGLEFFTKEKDILKKFKLYKAYLDLLVALREWCVVHSQCGMSDEPVQTDDPDDSREHAVPVFVVRRANSQTQNKNDANPRVGEMKGSRLDLDLGVDSIYIYDNDDMDSSVIDLAEESQLILNPGKNNPGPSKVNSAMKNNGNGGISETEFSFKKPRLPPPSHRPHDVRDEIATPGCSARARRGSEPSFSDVNDYGMMDTFDTEMQEFVFETVGEKLQESEPEREPEVCEDEWDAMEAEALAGKGSVTTAANSGLGEPVATTSNTNATLPCRKFLDCSLWEEQKNRPKVGYCQCRFHLIETFMLMTEEVIKFWRHLKIRSEFKKSKVSLEEQKAEQREVEFENFLEKVKNMEREEEKKSGMVKSQIDFEEEYLMSSEAPFWKRLLRDAKYSRGELTPECVGHALETAVDVMSNSYMTTQYNTFTAFGSDGANAFLIASSYLLHYLSDLNFCPDTVRLVHYISSSESVGLGPRTNPSELQYMEGSNYSWARDVLAESDGQQDVRRQKNPSGLSSFHEDLVLEKIPKFDPSNQAIVSRLPQVLVNSLVDMKRRKKQARKDHAHAAMSPRDGHGDGDVEIVDLSDSNSPKPGPVKDYENEVECNQKEDSSSSDTEYESENETQPSSDGWVTTDESSGDSDGSCPYEDGEGDPTILPPKPKSNHKTVEDYNEFCGPSIQFPKGCLDILADSDDSEEEDVCPKMTFAQFSALFEKENKSKKSRRNPAQEAQADIPNFKTIDDVCEELKRTPNFDLKNPELEKGIVDDSDDEDENPNGSASIPEMMVTLNRHKYYSEDKTLGLWDDYNVNPMPVDV